MSADVETRLKRLRMRAWRRGTREMDLLLGGYVDAAAEGLDAAGLDALEALLAEEDPALYAWLSGVDEPPEAHRALVAAIRDDAARRAGPKP